VVVQRENEGGIGVFLVHICVDVGVQSLVSHLSFCMCSANPPFPAVAEGTLLHLCCTFSGQRPHLFFHKSHCLAKVKGGFSLVSSATFLMSRLWPAGLIHLRPQCCWCLSAACSAKIMPCKKNYLENTAWLYGVTVCLYLISALLWTVYLPKAYTVKLL